MSAVALSDYNPEHFGSFGISAEAKKIAGKVVSIRTNLARNARVNSKFAALDSVYREANKEDWDGHGAAKADPKSYFLAREFLSQLPNNIFTPEIAVDPDGEISFEWYISNRKLIVLSIGGSGSLNYVGVMGESRQKGKENFSQQIPKTIMALFGRVLL